MSCSSPFSFFFKNLVVAYLTLVDGENNMICRCVRVYRIYISNICRCAWFHLDMLSSR
jgi:hypothetical protein